MERFSRRSKTAAADASGRFAMGARDAERAWGRSTGRITGMLRGIGGLLATVFGVRAIAGFVGSLVEANSALQQLRASFTTLTGSAGAADKLLAQIRDKAKGLPVAFSDAAASVRQLMAYGFQTTGNAGGRGILDVLQTLTDAASSQGLAGMDQRMEQIARAVGQIAAKGKVSTEELNQLREAGINASEALSAGLGLTGAELEDALRKGAIGASEGIDAIMTELEAKFGGSAERMAQTFEGKMIKVRDSFDRIKEIAGEELFGVLEREAGGLASTLDDLGQSDSFKDTVRALGSVMADLARLATEAVPVMLKYGSALAWGAAAAGAATGLMALRDGWRAASKEGAVFAQALAKVDAAYGERAAVEEFRTGKRDYKEFRDHIKAIDATKSSTLALEKAEGERFIKLYEGAKGAEFAVKGLYYTVDKGGQVALTRVGQMRMAFAKLGAVVKATALTVGRFAASMIGIPLLIGAVVTGVNLVNAKFGLWSRSISDTTARLNEQASAARRLRGELERLSGVSLAGAVIDGRYELDEAREDRDRRFTEVSDRTRHRLLGMTPAEVAEAKQAAETLAGTSMIGRFFDQVRDGSSRGGDRTATTDARATLRRLGLPDDMRTVDALTGALAAQNAVVERQTYLTEASTRAERDHYAVIELKRQQITDLQSRRGLEGSALEQNQAALRRAREELAELERRYNVDAEIKPDGGGSTTGTTGTTDVDDGLAGRIASLGEVVVTARRALAEGSLEAQAHANRLAQIELDRQEALATAAAERLSDEGARERQLLDVRSRFSAERVALLEAEAQINERLALQGAADARQSALREAGDITGPAERARAQEAARAQYDQAALEAAREHEAALTQIRADGVTERAQVDNEVAARQARAFEAEARAYERLLNPERKGIDHAEATMVSVRARVEGYAHALAQARSEVELLGASERDYEAKAQAAREAALAALRATLAHLVATGAAGEHVAEVMDAIDRLQSEAAQLPESVADAFAGYGEVLGNLTRLLDGLSDAAQGAALSKLVGVFADLADGIGQAAGALERYEAAKAALAAGTGSKLGALGAGLGVATAGASFVASMWAWQNAEQKERQEANRQFQDATRAFQKAVDEFADDGRVGAGMSFDDAEIVRLAGTVDEGTPGAVARLFKRGLKMDYGFTTTADGTHYTLEDLERALQGVLGDGFDLNDAWMEFLAAGGREWSKFMDSLGVDGAVEALSAHGGFSDTVAGAVAALAHFRRYLSDDANEALAKFTADLLDGASGAGFGDAARALLAEAGGLDLTTDGGRARLEEIVAALAVMGPSAFPGLSPDEYDDVLDALQGLSSGSTGDGVSQGYAAVRQITETQGAALLGYQQELTRIGLAQLDALLRMAGQATGPVTPTAPSSHVGGDVHLTIHAANDAEEMAQKAATVIRREMSRPRSRRRL